MAKSNAIIIKRVKKGVHGAHGGAWKVAYADFVTAMMAFFLLLWLLNATTNAQKRGIADYFAPTLATNSTVSGADGVMGGRTMMEPGSEASNSAPPSLSESLPRVPTNPDNDDDQMYGPGQSQGANDQSGNDESAQGYTANTQGKYQGADKGDGAGQGNLGGATDLNGKDAKSAGIAKDAKGVDTGKIPLALFRKLMAELEKNPAQKAQIEQGLTAEQKAALEKATAQDLAQKQETQQLQQVKEQIENALQTQPELQNLAKNVMVDKVEDGLRIQIIDQQKTAMFNLGSTQLSEAARKLLAEVATSISKLPNQIMITGHTDSTPYLANGDYSNWELSADRANAARRALVGDGFPENHIATVVGKADTDNLVKDNPADPRNRRISIIVLRANGANAPKPATVPPAAPAQAQAQPQAPAPAAKAQAQAAQAPIQATVPAQPAAPARAPASTPTQASAPVQSPRPSPAPAAPAVATPAAAVPAASIPMVTPAVATTASAAPPANIAIDGIGSAASLPGGLPPSTAPAPGSAAP